MSMVLDCLKKRLIRRWARVGLALSSVFMLTAASTLPANATPTRAASSADLNFYKGKTLTIISPVSPGDLIDLISRLYAQYMGKYLHATINVEDVPGSGNVIGANKGFTSRPDGLTLTDLDLGAFASDVIESYPGLKFSLSKWDYLGEAKTISENVMVAHPNSSLTFDDLMKKGSSKFKVLDVRSGINDASERILYGGFGIPVQYVTAFSTQGTLFQAFEAGQGDLAYEGWDGLAGEAVRAGKAKSILSVNVGTNYRFPGVPNYTTEIAKYKSRITKAGLSALDSLGQFLDLSSGALGVPPGTPPARVAALTQAMHAVVENPAFVKQAKKEQITGVSWGSAGLIKKDINAVLKDKALAKFLGKYNA